jgi:hypothetical protein
MKTLYRKASPHTLKGLILHGAKGGKSMDDIESAYSDYLNAQSSEGGQHSGRRPPSRQMLISIVIGLGLLIVAICTLALIPSR